MIARERNFSFKSFSPVPFLCKREVPTLHRDATSLPLSMILKMGAFPTVHGFFEAVNAALM
jgi:hypothetical protein